MLKTGLVSECESLMKTLTAKGGKVETILAEQRGVVQSIGFKELAAYLTNELSSEPDESKKDLYLKEGIAKLKVATRRYAHRQIKWITSRIKPLSNEDPNKNLIEFHRLDTSNVKEWKKNVEEPALRLVRKFLSKKPKKAENTPLHGFLGTLETWKKFECKDCEREFNGSDAYESHIKSKGHKKKKAALKRRAKQAQIASMVREKRRKKRMEIQAEACPVNIN